MTTAQEIRTDGGSGPGPVLLIDDLVKSYRQGNAAGPPIIDGLSLSVRHGEFVCIVGPSGCGKTTLLRSISGLVPRDSGRVEVTGSTVTRPPRELAIVFQDYARSLLPWMTVRKNVELPLTYMKVSAADRRERASHAIEAVGLAGAEEKHPWQLSGGMQQRVAIARAIAYQPEVLLMDEPFASVDAQTRGDLEDLLMELWASHDMTIVLVTHDIDESVYLADRVVVLSKSPTRVVEQLQVDLPRPRQQVETKADPRFVELRSHVLETLRSGIAAESQNDRG